MKRLPFKIFIVLGFLHFGLVIVAFSFGQYFNAFLMLIGSMTSAMLAINSLRPVSDKSAPIP